jgi:hypothetical protein
MALPGSSASQTIKVLEEDVRVLATQFVLDPSEAYDLLFNEIRHLESRARIQDFIPVLALKHVKARLRAHPPQSLIYGFA